MDDTHDTFENLVHGIVDDIYVDCFTKRDAMKPRNMDLFGVDFNFGHYVEVSPMRHIRSTASKLLTTSKGVLHTTLAAEIARLPSATMNCRSDDAKIMISTYNVRERLTEARHIYKKHAGSSDAYVTHMQYLMEDITQALTHRAWLQYPMTMWLLTTFPRSEIVDHDKLIELLNNINTAYEDDTRGA